MTLSVRCRRNEACIVSNNSLAPHFLSTLEKQLDLLKHAGELFSPRERERERVWFWDVSLRGLCQSIVQLKYTTATQPWTTLKAVLLHCLLHFNTSVNTESTFSFRSLATFKTTVAYVVFKSNTQLQSVNSFKKQFGFLCFLGYIEPYTQIMRPATAMGLEQNRILCWSTVMTLELCLVREDQVEWLLENLCDKVHLTQSSWHIVISILWSPFPTKCRLSRFSYTIILMFCSFAYYYVHIMLLSPFYDRCILMSSVKMNDVWSHNMQNSHKEITQLHFCSHAKLSIHTSIIYMTAYCWEQIQPYPCIWNQGTWKAHTSRVALFILNLTLSVSF